MLFGLHSQRSNARASLVHILHHRVLIVEVGGALVGGRRHGLHALDHARRGVQEAMAGVGWLQALTRPHKPWDTVHWGSVGDGGGEPGVQR